MKTQKMQRIKMKTESFYIIIPLYSIPFKLTPFQKSLKTKYAPRPFIG